VAPAGFVRFSYPGAGFGLSYPREWTRLTDPDPQVVLLAARQSRYSMQVRVIDLRNPIGITQLPAARAVTDRIVAANPTVKLVEGPDRISLGGLPGLFYFYTFTDPATGQLGVHSHFFVFRAARMIALLFQAVPAQAFHAESAVFDRVTGSFHTL
jgi:hypothetical protein